MSADSALRDLAEAHGVHLGFHDLSGQRLETPVPSLRALLAALGIKASSAAAVAESLAELRRDKAHRHLPDEIILTAGTAPDLALPEGSRWALEDEHGAEVAASNGSLPPLKAGYFTLHLAGPGWREESFVLVRPPHAPDLYQAAGQERLWGVTAALYGLRAPDNGGLGSYADLAATARALGQHGAQFLGINPVHALGWAADDVISPYSPSHRGFFNTDHIAPAQRLGPGPASDLIDYAAFRARHRPALEAEFAAGNHPTAFRDFCAARGSDLVDFACFEALSEVHGPDSRHWPAPLRAPGPAATRAAGKRAEFHRWLQWRAEAGIDAAQDAARDAGMGLGLYLDLAVGARPGGAEAWMHGDTIAPGVSIGAPPDQLSPAGQSWNLVAHAPGRMKAARYAPLRAMLRKLMGKCGLIRIDHALGLMRSYWLPENGSPGAYVSQPFEAFLAVVAIEAQRAGCVVVGEDLGLVPEGFRARMNGAGLYSYAVWQFESFDDGWLRPPGDLRPFSLACFSTHDTPTLQGFWYGGDIDLWRQMSWLTRDGALARHGARAHQRASLRHHAALPDIARGPEIARAIHGALAASPAAMVAVQLDDILGVRDAPNLPGTIHEHPNWRRRAPLPVSDISRLPELAALADTMRDSGRQTAETKQKGPIACPQ